MSQTTGAKYLVEQTQAKRRKMGIDIDIMNDSGIPMDGVELDSSTSTSREGGSSSNTTNEPANSSSLTSSSSNNNLNSSTIESSSRVASSTTNPTCSLLTSTTNQAESTHSSSSSSSAAKKKNLNSDDNSAPDGPNSIALADNEAVACQTSPNLDCGSTLSLEPQTARGPNNEPLEALARQVYQLNNLNQSEASDGPATEASGGGGSQNQQVDNDSKQVRQTNGSSNSNTLKSFGDLFDDDDLD